ncbi:MAG: peptidase T [Saccharofermentans sp.]|nr:peptidase T [Saccharofermentans sp.]
MDINKLTRETTDRLLSYVSVGTASDEGTGTHPSTRKQFDLAYKLVDELEGLGVNKVFLDEEHCYVYATIKGEEDLPKIGFISHMDTSPESCGDNIRPQIIKDYDGGDIALGDSGKVLSPVNFPELKKYRGQTLITTDGSTLLGADDKAGIAEIMTMAAYLLSHKDIKHGDIKICFTPDEEIGEGTEFFDIERFGADYAYTVDGGRIGEISYENFNAASCKISIQGANIHPGEAYGKMINSQRVALFIDSNIPDSERPETTKDREGFFHLISINGTVDKTNMSYIIRDHDKKLFEQKKEFIKDVCRKAQEKFPGAAVEADIKDSYYNMRDVIVPDHMGTVNRAIAAMEISGINPIIEPIRGGTDGAMLSFKGLPCPNLCAGGHNFHGVYEYVPAESMGRIAALLINIAALS